MNEIESLVAQAINLAKSFNHEYVTLEHLTTVVLDDKVISACVMSCRQIARVYKKH